MSEWSHNFRPAFLRLRRILHHMLNVTCILALTATATQATTESITKRLAIPEDGIIRGQSVPPNLNLSVSAVRDRREELLHLLQHNRQFKEGSAIVYCMRQADTENVAGFLRTGGVDAEW